MPNVTKTPDMPSPDPRQTAAYPPGPGRPGPSRPGAPPPLAARGVSEAATLFASPTSPGHPESMQATMFATSDLGKPGDPGPTQAPGPQASGAKLTLGRPTGTVLPDVHSEGERLTLVPRDKTRYESAKLLGRGGMGEVKLAHDHDIGRPVAVKRLLDEDNPHAVARFIDEVRTVGSLEHPNIVPIHDVGVDEDGALFFVMKYVEGETLASIIDKLASGDREYHRRYNFEARLDLFNGVLRALQYAHSQGLVHRDIKPENLMIGRYGEVVVMDWGIAHVIRDPNEASGATRAVAPNPRLLAAGVGTVDRASNATVDGAVVGTPQYMSPEQAGGEVAELDGRSDLYSAFVVLFELLSLQTYIPEQRTAIEMVMAAKDRQPPSAIDPLYSHNPHQDPVPAELRHFLRHGLANDKQGRYPSAEQVIWELERIRSGDCAVECPVTFMKHTNHKVERMLDRRPSVVLGAFALGLVGFVGGLAGWIAWLVG